MSAHDTLMRIFGLHIDRVNSLANTTKIRMQSALCSDLVIYALTEHDVV